MVEEEWCTVPLRWIVEEEWYTVPLRWIVEEEWGEVLASRLFDRTIA